MPARAMTSAETVFFLFVMQHWAQGAITDTHALRELTTLSVKVRRRLGLNGTIPAPTEPPT